MVLFFSLLDFLPCRDAPSLRSYDDSKFLKHDVLPVPCLLFSETGTSGFLIYLMPLLDLLHAEVRGLNSSILLYSFSFDRSLTLHQEQVD